MPNNRKKRDKIVIIKFLHHQAIEPMHSFLLRLTGVFHPKKCFNIRRQTTFCQEASQKVCTEVMNLNDS
jgi:hypothetical protein